MTPDEYTIKEHFLDVGDGHSLYLHDWGNKAAEVPVIFLHGGPGLGCGDEYKQRFDPLIHRVIFFDQRGAGKSTPQGELANNTIEALIGDIDNIADYFHISSFVLHGGSWGSCLALAYAIKYPKRISALVLQGIHTASRREDDYLLNGGWKDFFPDIWQQYLDRTPSEFHKKPGDYHMKQALGTDSKSAKLSAYAVASMEYSLTSLDDRPRSINFDEFDPNYMKIELHYFANNFFMPDRYILDNAHRITAPVWLVQGRYDMVCPPVVAYELHQKLPNSHLLWTVAGHGSNYRSNYDVLRTALLNIAS